MLPADTIICRDLYMRHTDKEGNSYVFLHRVWDADLFLRSQAEAAAKEGGKSKAEQITPQQYHSERTAR